MMNLCEMFDVYFLFKDIFIFCKLHCVGIFLFYCRENHYAYFILGMEYVNLVQIANSIILWEPSHTIFQCHLQLTSQLFLVYWGPSQDHLDWHSHQSFLYLNLDKWLLLKKILRPRAPIQPAKFHLFLKFTREITHL